ncbi:unnamed protein product [Somion occarium]|uniref:Uncharacterized protein n=1 Tax=Somion occarium TaxID=3059160 RepID=A0ABP1DUH5_9APHY
MAQFEYCLLTPNHPEILKSEPCPVTDMVGMPIRIYSEIATEDQIPAEVVWAPSVPTDHFENQPAVYLQFEPDSGFAPAPWRVDWGVGSRGLEDPNS